MKKDCQKAGNLMNVKQGGDIQYRFYCPTETFPMNARWRRSKTNRVPASFLASRTLSAHVTNTPTLNTERPDLGLFSHLPPPLSTSQVAQKPSVALFLQFRLILANWRRINPTYL